MTETAIIELPIESSLSDKEVVNAAPNLPELEHVNEELFTHKLDLFIKKIQQQMMRFNQPIPDFYEASSRDLPFVKNSSVLTRRVFSLGSPAFALGSMVNALTYTSRRLFGFFPFPQYDKISDVTAFCIEPFGYQFAMKLVVRFVHENLEKVAIATKLKKDPTFFYDSITEADIISAMLLYGGIWIGTELLGLMNVLPLVKAFNAPDPLDLVAYGLGLIQFNQQGKEILKRIPIGRFEDIERAVEMRVKKFETEHSQEGAVVLQNLATSTESSPEKSKALLSLYKKLCTEIHEEILLRSEDILRAIGKDPELIETYHQMMRYYAYGLARSVTLKRVEELASTTIDPVEKSRLQQKFGQRKQQSQLMYRQYHHQLNQR